MTAEKWTVEKINETMRTHANPSTLEGFRRKDYCGKGSADIEVADGAREFMAKITTNSIDRDREIVDPMGIDFANFRKNPVILWGHNYTEPAIGRAAWIKRWTVEGKTLGHISKGIIANNVQKAEDIFRLMQQQVLNTTSIGFVPISGHEPTAEEIKKNPKLKQVLWIHDRISMLEFSIVNVPANPQATIDAVSKGTIEIPVPLQQEMGIYVSEPERILTEQRELNKKKILPYKQTPLDGIDAGWDGVYEKDAATFDELVEMVAWVDTTMSEFKDSYRYLHHRSGNGNPVVWLGLAEAMSKLNRFIGIIPDEDRKGVWKHLAKHYNEYGKEPPALVDKATAFDIHTIPQGTIKAHNVVKASPSVQVVSIAKTADPVKVVEVVTDPEALAREATELFEVDYLGRV